MDRKTAVRKLRRCLQLAASSNPHEAAAALRQAQKLMHEFGLDEIDAQAEEYVGVDAPTRIRREDVPRHVVVLADLVAATFRCALLLGWSVRGTRVMKFIGPGSRAEVAAYAFTVLRRQLEADATHHVRRIRHASRRAEKAQTFGYGWVAAVRSLLATSPLSEADRTAADRYIAVRYGTAIEAAKVRSASVSGQQGVAALLAGFEAGSRARLHAGIGARNAGVGGRLEFQA